MGLLEKRASVQSEEVMGVKAKLLSHNVVEPRPYWQLTKSFADSDHDGEW